MKILISSLFLVFMNKPNKQLPIGVFDSGIGGLTVVKEIRSLLPNESIIYFGDTGRVPYGNKSKTTIIEYSLQITRFLLAKGIKALVIACNTATAHAYQSIQSVVDIPVIGVIEPGAKAALARTKSGRIGIFGTQGTINSKAYEHAIKQMNPETVILGQATPLLVPLVEEGWFQHPATQLIIREYLKPLENARIDTLVLGCTHYPLLFPAIYQEVFDSIRLVDSGKETAIQLRESLKTSQLITDNTEKPTYQWIVSDLNFRFKELGQSFLGEPFLNVHLHEWGG